MRQPTLERGPVANINLKGAQPFLLLSRLGEKEGVGPFQPICAIWRSNAATSGRVQSIAPGR